MVPRGTQRRRSGVRRYVPRDSEMPQVGAPKHNTYPEAFFPRVPTGTLGRGSAVRTYPAVPKGPKWENPSIRPESTFGPGCEAPKGGDQGYVPRSSEMPQVGETKHKTRKGLIQMARIANVPRGKIFSIRFACWGPFCPGGQPMPIWTKLFGGVVYIVKCGRGWRG